MKKSILIILSVVIFMLSIIPISAIENECVELTSGKDKEAQLILDSFENYVKENSTVTEHEDGVVVVEFDAADTSITLQEVKNATQNTSQIAQPIANAGSAKDYSYTSGQVHTPISFEDKYLYSLLDDEHKEYYRHIDSVVRNMEARATFNVKTSLMDNGVLYFMYMFDNPEYFYIGNTVTLYSGSKFSYSISYAANRDFYCKYEHTPSEITPELKSAILQKQVVFNNTVSQFTSTIPADAPELVKERLIYAKILRNSYYNTSAQWNGVNEDNWNAYGILCNGYGVCESYSEAFQVICHAVGIECTGVTGDAGGPHKWNAVKIDGEWYQCDITFDDPLGGDPAAAYDSYFNLTDALMYEYDHDWSTCEYTVPTCNSTIKGNTTFKYYYGEDANGTIHRFANRCDSTCETPNCSFTRNAPDHVYENGDTTHCIYCGDSLSGWQYIGGYWYYYEFDQKVTNTWIDDGNGKRYLGSDGKMATNTWLYNHSINRSVYVGDDGYIAKNQWIKTSEGLCYVDENGITVSDEFVPYNGQLVYISTDARKSSQTGWLYHGGSWYYLENGYMVTDRWIQDNTGWCYLGSYGTMLTNVYVDGKCGKFYINSDGYCLNYHLPSPTETPTNQYLVSEADCTHKATYTKSCSICGAISEGTFTYGDYKHTPHEKVDGKYLVSEATCTSKAIYNKSCSLCGTVINETFFYGSTLDHKSREYADVKYLAKKATCTEQAEYYLSCEFCGTALSKTFKHGSYAAHTPSETVADKYLVSPATTTQRALYNKSCSVCGAVVPGTFYYGETLRSDGWYYENGNWYYYENNAPISNKFMLHEGKLAYIDTTSKKSTHSGWLQYNGDWYYLENGYAATNEWKSDCSGWCYLGEDGAMVTNGFVPDSMGYCYIGENGYMLTTTGWMIHNDNWYYLESGYAVTNSWRLDSVGWCYLGEDGAMYTSTWLKDSVGWCYIDESGYCVVNTWMEKDGKLVYIGHEARVVTDGWVQYEGGWYFLENGEYVKNEWRLDSIGWCYLSETGLMVTNGFVPDSVGLSYIGGEGYFVEYDGWLLLNDDWYYLEKGYAVTNSWRLDSKGWCYLGEDGAMYTSTWLKDSVGWCYIDENGYCLANGTYTVDGHEYTFDENGRIQGEPIFAE